MLKGYNRIYLQIWAAADLVVVIAGFLIAYQIRVYLDSVVTTNAMGFIHPLRAYYQAILLILLCWLGALYFCGSYDAVPGRRLWDTAGRMARSAAAAVAAYGIVVFTFRYYFVSRVLVMLSFLVTGLLLFAERFFILYALRWLRKQNYNCRYVLVVGTGPRAENFLRLIHRHPEWGLRIVGLIDDQAGRLGKEVSGHQVIGTLEDFPKILNNRVIDEVVFIVPRSWMPKLENSILYCEELGKRVSMALDYFNLKFAQAKQTYLGSYPFITFETVPTRYWQLFLKRLIDIGISIAGLILLSPLMLFIACLIKTNSKGPVLFKQKRCCLNGRTFWLYKFRTMVEGAEAKLEEIRFKNEMSGPVFKLADDPRVTKAGKWLRKLSFDELPQLWNVIRGDMSFVGPRPPIPSEVEAYAPWQKRRLSMRPGLTCLWQVNGRNKIVDFNQWMNLDLQYIDTWSLALDLKILLKTIPVVLFGIGAK